MEIPITYDASYFQVDTETGLSHPAGYSEYKRLPSVNTDIPDDEGEEFKTINKRIVRGLGLQNCRILELGSARGFFITDAEELGCDVTGIDISEWAVTNSENPSKIILGNALEKLAEQPDNSFDAIIGLRFLPCIDDQDLPELLSQAQRVAPRVIFVVDDIDSYPESVIEQGSLYYNLKSISDWELAMPGCEITSYRQWLQP